jgi:hypothetical protein
MPHQMLRTAWDNTESVLEIVKRPYGLIVTSANCCWLNVPVTLLWTRRPEVALPG